VNLTNANADFSFRYTFADVVNLLGVKSLVWSSASVDASASSGAKAQADGMIGMGVLPTLLSPPTVIFAYGKGEATVDVKIDDLSSSLFTSHQGLGASFSGGAMAMSALSMVEMDPDDKVAGDVLLLRPFGAICVGKEINGDEGNLQGLTCTYNALKPGLVPSKSDAEVTITYITSKKAGILEYGKTPVSPRSYEMIIEIKNYPLTNEKNHVRMSLGFLSVSAGAGVNGSATEVIHREGMDDVYIAASEHVVVNGNTADVKVKVASGNPDIDSSMMVVLQAALGANLDARITTVDFPAGAKDFVYDPAVGAGKSVYEAGASTAALSLLLALVSVLLYLF